MRADVAKAVAAGIAICLTAGLTAPAQAQISDAAAALDSAVRKAQRLFSKPSKRRSSRRLRQSIHDQGVDKSQGAQTPAPTPAKNPVRSASGNGAVNAAKSRATAPPASTKSTGANAAATAQAPANAKVLAPGAANSANAAPAVAASTPATPPPDVWSRNDIAAAMKACKRILARTNAVVTPAAPIKRGPCGDAAPVKLIKLSGRHPVTFSPAATVNCEMVRALDTWMRRGLQPLAKKYLGSPIVKVSVMSSYSCRNAYGRKSTRLSEHGKANALDIGGFITADGSRTDLLAHWGPTERDIVAAAQKLEDARAKAKKQKVGSSPAAVRWPGSQPPATTAHGDSGVAQQPQAAPSATVSANAQPRVQRRRQRPNPNAQDGIDNFPSWYRNPSQTQTSSRPPQVAARPVPTQPGLAQTPPSQQANPQAAFSQLGAEIPPVPERRPSLRQRYLQAKAARDRRTVRQSGQSRDQYRNKLNDFLSYRNDLGGPKPKGDRKRDSGSQAGVLPNRAAFLRGAHRTACRLFGTVLGPEANEAHRNHFHVDLAPRKRSNYCR